MNDHLWCLKNWKIGARKAKEAQTAVNREKGRERENNKILFNNLWVLDIFVLLTVIIMQYLYDSV